MDAHTNEKPTHLSPAEYLKKRLEGIRGDFNRHVTLEALARFKISPGPDGRPDTGDCIIHDACHNGNSVYRRDYVSDEKLAKPLTE